MNREKSKLAVTLLFVMLFLQSLFAENEVTLTPERGSIVTGEACTISVTSFIPADSVVFSIDYRSPSGMLRKKNIGTVTNPPFRMILNTKPLKNQYFYGANAVAKIYRKDDTLQIVNAPQLFLLPDSVVTPEYSLFPSTYTDAPKSPFPDTLLSGVVVTRTPAGIQVEFETLLSEKSDETGITLIVDPLLSKAPFPGNDAVIIFVPLSGDAQLITTSESNSDETFSISRTGTKITLDKEISYSEHKVSGRINIPDFLLGGKVPNKIGFNILLPYSYGDEKKTISFVEGEEFMHYTPMLFPTFATAAQPEKKTNPYPPFAWAFLAGFTVMAIVFVVRRTPVTPEDVKPEQSTLLTTIEQQITATDLSERVLAQELKSSVKALNKECLRLTGKKIPSYISWLRIEIVKERLVSSNASEIAIAKECGFATVADMENSFHHFTGIAPYQFREKNGIK